MFKYLEVLFKHWVRFAALCVALPLIAGVAALYVFQGKDGAVQLWVDTPSYIGTIQTASGWNQYLTPAQNTADSLTQLIQTESFYKKVGQALIDGGTVSGWPEANQVLGDARTSLAAVANGSHLVTIKVECRTAAVCVQVLTTTVAVHRDWLIQTEKQQADVATKFYTSQLQLAKQHQQTTIDSYNAYVNNHQYPANVMRPADPELDRLQSDVQQAQTQVRDLQDRLQTIQFSNDAAAEIDQTALRVIDQPATSGGTFTQVTKKLAASIAAGAALPGIAYLVFLGWIDRTIRNPKEIEGRIGVRVVAMIGNFAAKPG
jgi:capsular polysaccharide biosynthesis protein